jgi:hypothetical protein
MYGSDPQSTPDLPPVTPAPPVGVAPPQATVRQPMSTPAGSPVQFGPRAYRQRIRAAGPFVALLAPALLGVSGALLLRGNTASAARGVGGFVLAVLAAPGLLVAGVPLRHGNAVLLGAVLASALMWFVLGVVASRRATAMPVCSWRDFWREHLWLAAGVWLGVLGAGLAANLVMGRALF